MGNAISSCPRCKGEVRSFDGYQCRHCDPVPLGAGDAIELTYLTFDAWEHGSHLRLEAGTLLVIIENVAGRLTCETPQGKRIEVDGYRINWKPASPLTILGAAADQKPKEPQRASNLISKALGKLSSLFNTNS